MKLNQLSSLLFYNFSARILGSIRHDRRKIHTLSLQVSCVPPACEGMAAKCTFLPL